MIKRWILCNFQFVNCIFVGGKCDYIKIEIHDDDYDVLWMKRNELFQFQQDVRLDTPKYLWIRFKSDVCVWPELLCARCEHDLDEWYRRVYTYHEPWQNIYKNCYFPLAYTRTNSVSLLLCVFYFSLLLVWSLQLIHIMYTHRIKWMGSRHKISIQ